MRRDFSKAELSKLLSASANSAILTSKTAGVGFNSAEILPGQVFFALKGAKVHGHQFVHDAISKGAALAVVEDQSFLSDKAISDRILVVPDTLKALHQMTAAVRNSFTGKVLGIVGSVGKTTTKDILAAIARNFVSTCNSVKSFNTNIGIPYTICNADIDGQLWVLELGMNHPGELLELAGIAKPDALLVTQIAAEHMEFFSSIREVADAEFEALSGLAPKGSVFLCADDIHAIDGFQRNLANWGGKPTAHFYGSSTSAAVRYRDFHHTMNNTIEGEFKIDIAGRELNIKTQLIGSHNAQNFSGAILALTTLFPTIELNRLPDAIFKISPSPHRLNQLRLSSGTLIIDDSYNSSPEAVVKALDILGELNKAGHSVGLILGDMRELGSESMRYHLELIPAIESCRPKFCVGVGEFSSVLVSRLNTSIKTLAFKDSTQGLDQIEELVRDVDIALFKASRGIMLDRSVKYLQGVR